MFKHTEPQTKATKVKKSATISSKENTAYSQISRILSEDDLKVPAVVKMIIRENDLLQAENSEFKKSKNNLLLIQLENATLREKLKTNTAFEIFSDGAISVGSILVGSTFPVDLTNIYYFATGIILFASGAFAKYIRRR